HRHSRARGPGAPAAGPRRPPAGAGHAHRGRPAPDRPGAGGAAPLRAHHRRRPRARRAATARELAPPDRRRRAQRRARGGDMNLAPFPHRGTTRIGVVAGDAIVDLAAAAPALPREMPAFLAAGRDALAQAEAAVTRGTGRLPLAEVHLEAPVPRPPKFLAIGLNYADHIAESGAERPAIPLFFNKQSTCVIGPSDAIPRPRVSQLLDYERELGFVIGRRCRHVPRERAAAVIAGYVVLNDVTVRDWQLRVPTWTLGKSFDTHGPMGPWLVTPDEVEDPHALRLRTWVNGELRQGS